ncbi:hypothetical protein OH77DRAFT_233184 [Trametes cingulata]|nr:hypothetical protein OH77DRAFT_292685 [Trametes cingulata]KAI0349046.1 hypothetical protein OH77DRAFT_233184 [Trametes cingulata]
MSAASGVLFRSLLRPRCSGSAVPNYALVKPRLKTLATRNRRWLLSCPLPSLTSPAVVHMGRCIPPSTPPLEPAHQRACSGRRRRRKPVTRRVTAAVPFAHRVRYDTVLLDSIFSRLAHPPCLASPPQDLTLSRPARVCDTLKDPPLRLLWASLPDLFPLRSLLAPSKVVGEHPGEPRDDNYN